MESPGNRIRTGFSIIELLAVVVILAVIAAIILHHVAISSDAAKIKINNKNKANLKAAVNRWYIEKGTWPAANLSDVGADLDYFPYGVPMNPTNRSSYTFDSTTQRVK